LGWELGANEWAEGILGGFPSHPLVQLDESVMPQELASARGAIGAFVTARPHLLHAHPGSETAAGRAWPSPRSWDMAARLIAASATSGAPDAVAATLVAGAVGPVAAAEFLAWREDLDLPDAETVLRDPSSLKLPARG